MAGINQHYIPQFLQRGFASHKSGRISYIWEFRKGTLPENRPVKDFGAEPHFYNKGTDTSIDDRLTDEEQGFAVLVQRLRVLPAGMIAEPGLAEFLAHIEVRTRHLRQSFVLTSHALMDRIFDLIASDVGRFADMVLERVKSTPGYLGQMLDEEIAKTPIQRSQRAMIKELALREADKVIPTLRPKLMAELLRWAGMFRDGYKARVGGAAKDGHLRALAAKSAPEVRIKGHGSFLFKIVDVPAGGMVLGDSVLLFLEETTQRFRPMTQKGHNDRAVILPLTPSKLLVGERVATVYDFAEIKRAAALCSLEFFLGHENSAENQVLKEQIGTEAGMLSDEEIEEIAVGCFVSAILPKA
jgi:hypothetical protein